MEGILLLRGKTEREDTRIREVVIPPFSTRGNGFSSFPLYALPMDFSIVGTAHSHPSGVTQPSFEDLNHFYGRLMIIVGYPYESERNMVVYNRKGEAVSFEVSDQE